MSETYTLFHTETVSWVTPSELLSAGPEHLGIQE